MSKQGLNSVQMSRESNKTPDFTQNESLSKAQQKKLQTFQQVSLFSFSTNIEMQIKVHKKPQYSLNPSKTAKNANIKMNNSHVAEKTGRKWENFLCAGFPYMKNESQFYAAN